MPIRFTGPGGRFTPQALLLAVRLVLDGETDEALAVLGGAPDLDAREAAIGSDAMLRTRRWLPSVETRLA